MRMLFICDESLIIVSKLLISDARPYSNFDHKYRKCCNICNTIIYILSVNEKLPVNQVQLTHDNIWFIL